MTDTGHFHIKGCFAKKFASHKRCKSKK